MMASRVVCSCGVVIGLWGSGAVSSASCGFLVLMASSGSVLASSWVSSPGPVVVEVVALSISFSMCRSLFRSARACRVEVSRKDKSAGTMFLAGSNLYSCIFSLFNGPSCGRIFRGRALTARSMFHRLTLFLFWGRLERRFIDI